MKQDGSGFSDADRIYLDATAIYLDAWHILSVSTVKNLQRRIRPPEWH
ncbi:MAG: hypothetical protein QQW96_01275 [Tychonema bourrellyi B0820]|nr:hypothetical protein [Tychonema bourrellyi]MDQ2096268.1 hypothetical protein [Tychonema bourrellyi B0820]